MDNELEAKEIYILMSKEHKISRNVRAEWYLKRLNSHIKISRKRHIRDYNEELEVISVLPVNPPCDWDYDIAHEYSYLVTESSQLHFLSRQYRLAICLDLSSSLSSTYPDSEIVFFDGIITMLQQFLKGIIKPFYIPGSQILFYPKVYINVIAHIPYTRTFIPQVLVQGHLLVSEKESMQFFLKEISSKAQHLLNEIAKITHESYDILNQKQFPGDEGYNNVDGNTLQRKDKQHILVSSDVAFIKMIQHSILSLQLLPENSMAGIIILTDGVISLPNANIFDGLLVHLRTLTISCSFMQLSNNYQLHSGLGYVPFSELMAFFADATYGVYFKELPHVKKNFENNMNDYHRAFLTWGFQTRSGDEERTYLKTGMSEESSIFGEESATIIHKKELSMEVNTTLNAVVSCRIREGYMLKSISVTDEHILVILVLPWKYCVSIEYHVKAQLPATTCLVQTETWIEASFEFLKDVSVDQCNPDFRSQYRRRLVMKYWNALLELKNTDITLAGLQQFASCTDNYIVPDCFPKGQAVFQLHPETNIPEYQGNIQHPQFEKYWKLVCLMDINKWQTWMHTHRIGLILEHDSPVPINLQISNTSGKYGIIKSVEAELALTTFLKEWTDITLLNNFLYVKLLVGNEDKQPTFIVVRLTTIRHPCLFVRMAFLGGTSGRLRNKVVKEFKNRLSSLVIRGRKGSIEEMKPTTVEEEGDDEKDQSEGKKNDIPCCLVINKPIDKILIWYDRSLGNTYMDFSSQKSLNLACRNWDGGENVPVNNYKLLRRYLYHRRWIWNLEQASSNALSTSIIPSILNALMRIRLQEGFKFAYAKDGMVSLIKQYELKVNFHENIGKLRSHIEQSDLKSHCIVQYLIFPPKFSIKRISLNDDSEESDGVEAGESQIITECWVEPQNGNILSHNMNYEQLANSFSPVDKDCIISLATFECLAQIDKLDNCDEPTSGLSNTIYKDRSQFPIEKIEFAPRVTSLISKCQQTEILFSSLVQSCCSVLVPKYETELRRSDVANGYFYTFFVEHLRTLHGNSSFYLSHDESHKLPKILHDRFNLSNIADNSPFLTDIPEETRVACNWRCFVKHISRSHFFMTLLPATYEDLKKLFLNEINIRETNVNCLKMIATVDDLAEFDDKKVYIMDKITEFIEYQLTSDSETIEKSKRHLPSHSASLSVISQKLNFNQDCFKSLKQTVSHLPTPINEPGRMRYKSGPALPSQGITLYDNIQPTSRERASSLYSNKAKGIKTLKETETPKASQFTIKNVSPQIDTSNLRKRNASMPTKTNKELSHNKNSDDIFMWGGKTENKNSISEHSFPEYDDLMLGSAILPVYVYDSRLKVISGQLFKRTNYNSEIGKDVHIDSTFKNCSPTTDWTSKNSESSYTSLNSPDSFSEESKVVGNPAMALQRHLESVELCHRRGFVRGIFQSLTGGFYVHGSDVLSALHQCKEIVEEIDLTDFLKVICGHLKDFLSPTTEGKKLRFESETQNNDENDTDRTLFSLKLLKQHHPNRELTGVQRDIKQIFNEILLKNFKPIPNLPEYYYYCPSASSVQDVSYHCENCRSKRKPNKVSGCSNLSEEDDVISFGSRCQDVEMEAAKTLFRECEFYDRQKCGSKITDDDDRSYCELVPDNNELEVQPLFLHLTCTTRIDKHVINTCSISSLPTCLGELSENFGVDEVDLEKVSISLDVLVLTLAGAAPVACETMESSFKLDEDDIVPSSPRSTSFGDSSILVSDNQSFIEEMAGSPTETDQEIFFEVEDHLSNIPSHQGHAIHTTYDKIRWFLQNEVISSNLYNCPVTENTLDCVISHIENFGPISNCKIEMIPLNFIYNMEQSMNKFSEELRRVGTPGYHLEKKGSLSFLVQSPDHLRRRHLSSLVPPLICSSKSSKRGDDHKDDSEELLFSKSVISSPDGLKSPRRLAQRVSFESDSDHVIVTDGYSVMVITGEDKQEDFNQETASCEDHLFEERELSTNLDSSHVKLCELTPESLNLFQLANRQECHAIKLSAEISKMKQLQSYDLKMRHNSGHGGIQSDLSSLLGSGLMTEDECEADISDSNDSNDWLQDFEPPPLLLPDFWLLLKSSSRHIHIYFHHRNEEGLNQWDFIYQKIIQSVRTAVQQVNQRLLLQELCETKLCNDLLEPQLSDDSWGNEYSTKDSESEEGRILEGEMKFEAGAFSCSPVWKASFDLHPRVKSSVAKTGISAINSLKTCLKPFSVVNRKNMFVYEDSSGVRTNVFYLRLHEYLDQPTSSLTTPEVRRDDTATCKSPLLIHAAKRLVIEEEIQPSQTMEFRQRLSSFGEKDIIVEGVLSTPVSRPNKDFIELSVHGVGSPGPAIKEELVQMLQRKLDDNVLDAICLTLLKNPHHKLSQEDVRFIQPPNQEPAKILRFVLSSFVKNHFQAVTWYLKQNMTLAGFSVPKYSDSKAEFHFKDFSESESDKGVESCIYLFVCKTKEGTKSTGIACIAVSVCNVDYENALPFRKEHNPEKNDQKLNDLMSFLELSDISDSPSSVSEGNAVLQFKIWESGRLDITELGRSIFEAIQHALWDFTMEYQILTIPPVSSGIRQEEVDSKSELKGAQVMKRTLHGTAASPSNPPSAFQNEMQTKFYNKSPMKDRRSSDYSRSSKYSAQNVSQISMNSSSVGEKCESEVKELNVIYSEVIIQWLEFAVRCNTPSVRKKIVKCPTKSSISVIITELQKWSQTHLDQGNKVFHKIERSNQFVEIQLPMKKFDIVNCSENQEECFILNMNGNYCSPRPEHDLGELTFALTRGKKNKRFEPCLAAVSEGSATPGSARPLLPNIVPRQICFVGLVRKKELTFYTYNWAKDLNDSLYAFFNKINQWSSARARLLSSMAIQKLGIFHNQPFIRKDCKDASSRKDDKREEKNVFIHSWNYVESLIKCPAPNRSINMSAERNSQRTQNQPTLSSLLRVYKNCISPDLTSYKKDFLQIHGKQMAEVFRCTFMRERERSILESNMNAPETPTTLHQNRLHVLKKNSRIEHFCLTPLLFLPRWRRHVAIICDQFSADPWKDSVSPKKEMRSRHGSGTSNRANACQTELRRTASLGATHFKTSPIQIRKRHVTMGDDKWYDALCLNYLNEFIQYLQSLGFVSVSIKLTNEKNKNQGTKDHFMTTPTYLMKNIRNGTILLQITFLEPFFSTCLYAIDSSRLNISKKIPIYETLPSKDFMDDIDIYKDLLHMHSFTYDYHLRAVCDSVVDRQLLFTPGYNFFSLLSEFTKYYSKSPSYARDLIHQGEITITDTGTTDEQLYHYVLSKEKWYDMKVVRMNPVFTNNANDLNTEFALVQTKTCSFEDGNEDVRSNMYEVTLVICHDLSYTQTANEVLNDTLNLKFFIILTSKKDLYPNRSNDRSGRFRTVSTAPVRSSSGTFSGDGQDLQKHIAEVVSLLSADSFDSVCSDGSNRTPIRNLARHNSTHVGIKQENVTYLGYFSPYEIFMQNVLQEQADQSMNRIKDIFNRAKVHCRRDSLWQKLNVSMKDDERGKSSQINMTHSELTELLKLVTIRPFPEFDSSIVRFNHMSTRWQQGLAKMLCSKYQEKSRVLWSPDGDVQLIFILSPHCSDICIMLTINHETRKAKLQCVLKELQSEYKDIAVNERTCSFIEDVTNCVCFYLWTTMIG